MSIRLYDSAWVQVDGIESPLNAHKDRQNAAHFQVGDHIYDVDGRSVDRNAEAPRLIMILSLQAAKEAGCDLNYRRTLPNTRRMALVSIN